MIWSYVIVAFVAGGVTAMALTKFFILDPLARDYNALLDQYSESVRGWHQAIEIAAQRHGVNLPARLYDTSDN